MKLSNLTSTISDINAVLRENHVKQLLFDKSVYDDGQNPISEESKLKLDKQLEIVFDYIDDNVIQPIFKRHVTESKSPTEFEGLVMTDFGPNLVFKNWNEETPEKVFEIRYDEDSEAYCVIESGETTPYLWIMNPIEKKNIIKALDKIAAHAKKDTEVFEDLIEYQHHRIKDKLKYSPDSTLDLKVYGDVSIPELLGFVFLGFTVDYLELKDFALLPIDLQEQLVSLNLNEYLDEPWSENHILYRLTETFKLRLSQKPETLLNLIQLKFEYTECLDGEFDEDFVQIILNSYKNFYKYAIDNKIAHDSINAWIFESMGDAEQLAEVYPEFYEDVSTRGIENPKEFEKVLAFIANHKGMQEQVLLWNTEPQYK